MHPTPAIYPLFSVVVFTLILAVFIVPALLPLLVVAAEQLVVRCVSTVLPTIVAIVSIVMAVVASFAAVGDVVRVDNSREPVEARLPPRVPQNPRSH